LDQFEPRDLHLVCTRAIQVRKENIEYFVFFVTV